MNQVVQLKTNQSKLVKNLKFAFSNSFSAMPELIQNGRRAGATRILIDYDETTKRLTVIDDGCGIQDFQNLLTLAESGWNQEIQATESPYGLGFLASIFSCRHVTVSSLGREISFATEDVLSFRDVHVQPSDYIGRGTRVVMEDCTENIMGNFQQLAKGFPIPVILNGTELQRPHSLNSSFVATPVGDICIDAIHVPHAGGFGRHGDLWVYLQGLLVKHDCYPDFSGVVHLDSTIFKGRLPDRDKLVNEPEVMKQVEDAGIALIQEYLRKQLAEMGEYAFLDAHQNDVSFYYKPLLNELSIIPKKFLMKPDDSGHIDMNDNTGNTPYSSFGKHLSRKDIESGSVILLEFDGASSETSVHWFLLQHTNRPICLVDSLPDGHWATPYIKHVFDENVEVEVIGIGKSAPYYGQWVGETVVLCDAIRLSIPSMDIEAVVDDDALFDRYKPETCILVPKKCVYPGSVVFQVSSFVNEYDEFQESIRENEESDLNAFVLRLRTDDPAALLASIIERECDLRHSAYASLRTRTFTLFIDESGKAQVMASVPDELV